MPRFRFTHAPMCWEFLNEECFVTGIMGPLGSGKSFTCCVKLMKLACLQPPSPNGFRRTRWAVIRNTYPELRMTTIKTWLELFPEANCGPIVYSHPITHMIKRLPTEDFKFTNDDKTEWEGTPGLECEVLFLAMDKADDIKHLKSLDLTGAWVNEAIEISPGAIDMLTGRVGRFPMADEMPARWAGLILDTNAPDDQNWWYKASEMGEGVMDEDIDLGIPGLDLRWRFFKQPPAVLEVENIGGSFFVTEGGFEPVEVPASQCLPAAGRYWFVNPDAENLPYLRPGYYHQQVQNKTLEWINRFMQAKYIYMVDGKPWVPEYNDNVMGSTPLNVMKDRELIGGIDAGGGTLNPAAVIGQQGVYGDWRILYELSLFDIGIERFSSALKSDVAKRFPGMPAPKYGLDPAGRGRDQIYETAVEEHLRSRGVDVQLAPSNNPSTRRDALALPMGRMLVVNSKTVPGFLVDPSCKMLRAALAGKWFRKTVQTIAGGNVRYQEKPYKNEWSHVGDACSYMTLTFGEYHNLVRDPTTSRGGFPVNAAGGFMPVQMPTAFNPFEV